MIRIFLPLICAALGLMAASCGQSAGPFAPAGAPARAHPDSHGAASAAMASPPDPQAQSTAQGTAPPSSTTDQTASAAPQTAATSSDQLPPLEQASPASGSQEAEPTAGTATDRRASTLIGMPVVSSDGSSLGAVTDIVFDRQGRATHLVIAYGTEPQAGPPEIPDDGKPLPTPDGKLTAMPWDAAVASIKSGRLLLDPTQLQSAPSFTPGAWPNLDDPSWSASTDAYWRKAVRAAIAAHPGAPIDSTTRQRGRPARDGY